MACPEHLTDSAELFGHTQPSQAIDQQAVFDFLQNPKTHAVSDPVVRIDTHGAVVFLAGSDVFKVKRAVQYDYMDFSTLALREKACRTERAVNQGNAADFISVSCQ